jgi:aspartyl-tRNA(Asn)/glutamyl-tRNA(Gln) amidotransferase subunit B
MNSEREGDVWEPVIGLEIHIQLNTKSKLFSLAPNRFGDEPNCNITEVCTGQPGSLPLLNREAVRKAIQFGCAVHSQISLFSTFDRKSYFYPDSPRNFQITQSENPLLIGGYVMLDDKKISIHHTHLEDDAGMLKHFSTFAGVDYNRAGVPLIEVVSDPCMHSSQEAVEYAMAIRAIMEYLEASDCNMEEGSLRIDANVSVRKRGETSLRKKAEIKNLNSFNNLKLAIDDQLKQQIQFYTLNPEGVWEGGTYRYDPEKNRVTLMRAKEEATDYRYFPEPDLPPLVLTAAYVQSIRDSLPELPQQRQKRYLETHGLPPATTQTLINDKQLSDFFEKAASHTSSVRPLANWILVEFMGRLKEKNCQFAQSGLKPEYVATLVNLIDSQTITGKIAKEIADIMVAFPEKDPRQILEENPDFRPLTDQKEIEALIEKTLDANPKSIHDYQSGKGRALDFLIGQVMKQCKGKATPSVVHELLLKKLESI